MSILAKGGSVVIMGLFGTAAKIPITMNVLNEYKIFGLWGNFNELREVIELLNEGIVKNNITKFKLDDVNEAIKLGKRVRLLEEWY